MPGYKKGIGGDEEFVIVKTDFLLAVSRSSAGNLPVDLRHTLFVRCASGLASPSQTRTIF